MGILCAGRIWPLEPSPWFRDNLRSIPASNQGTSLQFYGYGPRGIRRSDLDCTIFNRGDEVDAFRICYFLAKRAGSINTKVAEEGLAYFAELVEEAKGNPGKYRAIDMLLNIIENNAIMIVKLDGIYMYR